MMIKKTLILTTLAVLMLTGCDDFECCFPSFIQLNRYNITLEPATSNTADVVLTSSHPWEVTDKPDWITVDPSAGGDGSMPVSITAGVNDTGTQRNGVVTFTAANGYKAKLNVTQTYNTTPIATDGVLINGIVWAACNVDAFGTFAAKPEDAGMFYQWNRPKAWPATGSVTGWNPSDPSGDTWEAANDPCPTGWRVPTTADFLALSNTDNVTYAWTTLNGVDGGRFTDKTSDAWIFFPAAGYRNSSNGALYSAGSHAYYWSSTQSSSTNAYYLNSSSGSLSQSGDFRAAGRSVRCVKD